MSLDSINRQINTLEDDANVKTGVIKTSEIVLLELAEKHQLTKGAVGLITQFVRNAVFESTSNDYYGLVAAASQGVNEAFIEGDMEQPGLAKDFTDNLKEKLTLRLRSTQPALSQEKDLPTQIVPEK